MIKNIIFDLGGVLVDWNPVDKLRRMGLPEDEVNIIAQNTAFSAEWNEIDKGAIEKEKLFDVMLARIPEEYRKDAASFLNEGVFDAIHSFSYSAGWLKSLKERGLSLYLLTNYSEWMFDYHYKNEFSFTDSIDGMVVSGKVKLLKPDRAIYEALMKKYGLKSEECVFFDDRAENVEGARKCGINGIVFTDFETARAKLNSCLEI
ncbi:MAG: HAD family phosphatase [Spirochaetaceae bacterium]|nr:HAD family phosphatase [Spirochaetaceae bacterium]